MSSGQNNAGAIPFTELENQPADPRVSQEIADLTALIDQASGAGGSAGGPYSPNDIPGQRHGMMPVAAQTYSPDIPQLNAPKLSDIGMGTAGLRGQMPGGPQQSGYQNEDALVEELRRAEWQQQQQEQARQPQHGGGYRGRGSGGGGGTGGRWSGNDSLGRRVSSRDYETESAPGKFSIARRIITALLLPVFVGLAVTLLFAGAGNEFINKWLPWAAGSVYTAALKPKGLYIRAASIAFAVLAYQTIVNRKLF